MEKNESNTPAKYDQIILLSIMPKVVLFEIDQINLGSRPSVPFELRSAVVARASSHWRRKRRRMKEPTARNDDRDDEVHCEEVEKQEEVEFVDLLSVRKEKAESILLSTVETLHLSNI